MAKEDAVEKMQEVLRRLGIPLSVVWAPYDSCPIHGEIKQGTSYIYDQKGDDACATFMHEIIEFKLKKSPKSTESSSTT